MSKKNIEDITFFTKKDEHILNIIRKRSTDSDWTAEERVYLENCISKFDFGYISILYEEIPENYIIGGFILCSIMTSSLPFITFTAVPSNNFLCLRLLIENVVEHCKSENYSSVYLFCLTDFLSIYQLFGFKIIDLISKESEYLLKYQL